MTEQVKTIPRWGRMISGVIGVVFVGIGLYWVLASVGVLDLVPTNGPWWIKFMFGAALIAAGGYSIIKYAVLGRAT